MKFYLLGIALVLLAVFGLLGFASQFIDVGEGLADWTSGWTRFATGACFWLPWGSFWQEYATLGLILGALAGWAYNLYISERHIMPAIVGAGVGLAFWPLAVLLALIATTKVLTSSWREQDYLEIQDNRDRIVFLSPFWLSCALAVVVFYSRNA